MESRSDNLNYLLYIFRSKMSGEDRYFCHQCSVYIPQELISTSLTVNVVSLFGLVCGSRAIGFDFGKIFKIPSNDFYCCWCPSQTPYFKPKSRKPARIRITNSGTDPGICGIKIKGCLAPKLC